MDTEKEPWVKKETVDGAFMQSLTRKNSDIKNDRALALSKKTRLAYKRMVEDYEQDLDNAVTERDGMLDLSPSTIGSLTPARDFDHDAFVKRDIEIGVKIRNLEIKLEIAKARYAILFGAVA